jgi:hypothetical protein
MLRQGLLVCLSLLGAACVVHVDGDRWDDVDRAIDRTAEEVNLHYARIMEVGTATEARAEIARHAPVIRARLAEVRHRLDDSGCFGDGSSMYGMTDAAASRVDAYLAEVGALDGLSAVRDACARYGDDMDHLLGQMMDRWYDTWCP